MTMHLDILKDCRIFVKKKETSSNNTYMNFKTWFLLFVSFLASICCQARSIQHPSYLLGSSGLSISKLERIEIGKKTTALIFALNAFEDQITLPGNVYLTAAGDSLPLLSAVAYRHRCDEDSARQVTKGEAFAFQEGDSLRLVFPRLPHKTTTFDYFCINDWGSGKMLGIRTDGHPYPALLPPAPSLRPTGALPDWPRRYAPAVVRGRVHGLPQGEQYVLRVWANSGNIKDNPFPEITDTCGLFCLKYDLAYPILVDLSVLGYPLNFPLCPGDTITIDYDLNRAANAQYVGDYHPEKKKALHIHGGMTSLLSIDSLLNTLWSENSSFQQDSIEKVHHQSYAEFRQSVWECHQNRLSRYAALPLSEGEREYLQLASEKAYLDRCNQYTFINTLPPNPLDSAQLAAPEKQMDFQDPHAAQLLFPHTLHTAYVTSSTSYKTYLAAYGLQSSVMGRWLEQLDSAAALVARVKAAQPVSAEEIKRQPTEYQTAIRELQAQLAPQLDSDSLWTPQGDPETYLSQIVARHPGKVVFIDFWATWCGPCNLGIKEMEKVKDELENQGVIFVYITNNSSSTDGFMQMKRKHRGEHYIFTEDDWKKMKIPGYNNAIPHYLIYGPNGQLKESVTGWPGVEPMKEKILHANE